MYIAINISHPDSKGVVWTRDVVNIFFEPGQFLAKNHPNLYDQTKVIKTLDQTYVHICIGSACIKKELAISGLMESDVIRSVWLDI